MEPFRKGNWSAGASNIAPRDRLPENSLRSGVNVDPLPGGRLALRAGFRRAYTGANVRAVLALGQKLLIADGTDLVEFNASTNSSRVLRQITGAGQFTGDVLNDKLYFSTANECLEYDGDVVRPWGVPDVLLQPAIEPGDGGTLQPGVYQVAMTYTDQWGREGGTDCAARIKIVAGDAIYVEVPELPVGCKANIYVSSVNGSTLYLQRVLAVAGWVGIGSIDDDRAICETMLARAPQPGHIVRAHNSMLVSAIGKHLQPTKPMRPHLVDRARSFYQYPERIGMVRSGGGVLFVSADKTYALSGIETSEPSQQTIFQFPAIPGTDVELPGGNAAWMTPYGQAVTGDGVQLLNRDTYAIGAQDGGVAGFLKHNGNNIIVTVMAGPPKPSPLASTDTFIGEGMHP